jgi:hypothetical protein
MMAARSWIRVQTLKNKQEQSADCKGWYYSYDIWGATLIKKRKPIFKIFGQKTILKKGVTLFLHGQLALAAVNQPQIHSLLRLLRQRL